MYEYYRERSIGRSERAINLARAGGFAGGGGERGASITETISGASPDKRELALLNLVGVRLAIGRLHLNVDLLIFYHIYRAD